MDGIFEKFGIYDFLGIMGPGTVTVTYYILTYNENLNFLTDGVNLSPNIETILLYTVVSYFIGVVIHELGRFLSDCLNLFSVKVIAGDISPNKVTMVLHKILQFATRKKNLKKEIDEATQHSDVYDKVSFWKAISELKYNNQINTKRIDVHHSVYGLSRGLSVSFLIHLILSTFVWKISIKYSFADIIFFLIFFCRAYRYYFSWVKNVYIQYYVCIIQKARKMGEKFSYQIL